VTAKPISKYREILENSLKQLDHEARRAENEDFDPDVFVDRQIVEQLEKPDWQVIYGRRGSGKTTLFQAFQNQMHSKGENLCIYVSLKNCCPPNNGNSYTADEYASVAYREFIKKISTTIFESAVSQNSFVSNRILQSNKRKAAEDIIQEIAKEVEDGTQTVERVNRKEVRLEKRESEVSFLAKFTSVLGLSGKAQRNQSSSRSIEDAITYNHNTRYRHVREQFRNLCQCLEFKGIYLLLDEWVSLDESGRTTIQPAFAELLKRTFSGSKKFSIKIASISQQTRLYSKSISGKYIGLEHEADFFECADLDSVYANELDIGKFYKELLYRRLLRHGEHLIAFSERNTLGHVTYRPAEGFIENIFSTNETFHDVVTASAGNPRDFMILIGRIAKHYDFSLEKLWGRGDVLRVIRILSVSKETTIPPHSPEKEIVNKLKVMAIANNSRVFLVEKDINRFVASSISNLYMNRIIHPVKKVDVPPKIREHCTGYYLDFGKFLDVTEEFKDSRKVPECPFDASSTLGSVSNYILKTDGITAPFSESVDCIHCGATFQKSVRSYQVKGLCSECFEPQLNSDSIQVPYNQ
jgi:energy-coupling factor transporter ATP-binding protein EcfA2